MTEPAETFKKSKTGLAVRIAAALLIAGSLLVILPLGLLASGGGLLRLFMLACILVIGLSLLTRLFWRKDFLMIVAGFFWVIMMGANYWDGSKNIKEECDFFAQCTPVETGYVCNGTRFNMSRELTEKRCMENGYWPSDDEKK